MIIHVMFLQYINQKPKYETLGFFIHLMPSLICFSFFLLGLLKGNKKKKLYLK